MSPRQELARLIDQAANITVFTGAGISTESVSYTHLTLPTIYSV